MPESVKTFFDNLGFMPADFWRKVVAGSIVLFILSVVFKKIVQLSQVVSSLRCWPWRELSA
jgi:hypothetical protein